MMGHFSYLNKITIGLPHAMVYVFFLVFLLHLILNDANVKYYLDHFQSKNYNFFPMEGQRKSGYKIKSSFILQKLVNKINDLKARINVFFNDLLGLE